MLALGIDALLKVQKRTLPLRPQEASMARPLVNLLPPGEEGIEIEMNLNRLA